VSACFHVCAQESMSSYFVFMGCQRGFCRSNIEDSVICLRNVWPYNSALSDPGYVFMLQEDEISMPLSLETCSAIRGEQHL